MPQIGIRELKNDASEIIRAVREQRAEYVVTHHGEPVAIILPVDEATRMDDGQRILARACEHEDYWRKWDELAAEINATWVSDKSGVELVEEQRRG